MYDNDCEERPTRRLPKREPVESLSLARSGALLDYEQTGERLGVSARMVRRLWERRELMAVKVGRHVRFTEAEIARFIRDNSAGGAA
ncbi:MAG: helix-turn-helix domain-containing protein [Candidatus Nanopelagicales bacterium]